MLSIPTAPCDPVFWMHHAEIDRIWAEWQAANPARTRRSSAPRRPWTRGPRPRPTPATPPRSATSTCREPTRGRVDPGDGSSPPIPRRSLLPCAMFPHGGDRGLDSFRPIRLRSGPPAPCQQTRWPGLASAERVERAVLVVQQAASVGRDPQSSFTPSGQPANVVIRHRWSIEAGVNHEPHAIEADQPARCAQPQVAIGCLGNRSNAILRQPIVGTPRSGLTYSGAAAKTRPSWIHKPGGTALAFETTRPAYRHF